MYNNENTTETSQYTTYQPGDTEAFEQTVTKETDKEPKEKKGTSFLKKALLSISLGLFFGLFAGIGFYAVQQATGAVKQADGEAVDMTMPSRGNEENSAGIAQTGEEKVMYVSSDVSDVVEEVMPAMVSIINNYTETGNFFGQTFTQEQASRGTGIIVAQNETELLIVTNHHVVSDTDELKVTFTDGTDAEAKIKGMDADMDLAVIAVSLTELSEETKSEIVVAKLGDSDTLKLGEPVIAIGNALGYGQSVTNGIVSALDREITLADGSKGTFIQTNAAINRGNSGGALLNINGEVIGINSNKLGGSTVEGMGFAIPISSASPIIAELMERDTRDKVEDGKSGYMGLSLQDVTAQISAMYNMPTGVYVIGVEDDEAADKAGIMKGDIITRFDGEKVSCYDDLFKIMQYYAPGDTAKVTVMRPENGEYVQYVYEVELGERPSDNE